MFCVLCFMFTFSFFFLGSTLTTDGVWIITFYSCKTCYPFISYRITNTYPLIYLPSNYYSTASFVYKCPLLSTSVTMLFLNLFMIPSVRTFVFLSFFFSFFYLWFFTLICIFSVYFFVLTESRETRAWRFCSLL